MPTVRQSRAAGDTDKGQTQRQSDREREGPTSCRAGPPSTDILHRTAGSPEFERVDGCASPPSLEKGRAAKMTSLPLGVQAIGLVTAVVEASGRDSSPETGMR